MRFLDFLHFISYIQRTSALTLAGANRDSFRGKRKNGCGHQEDVMKDYKSVLDMAEELKQWPAHTLLIQVGLPEKRAEVLEITFLRAARSGDDEAARICYALLLKNFEDMSAMSATQGRNGDERLTRAESEAIVTNANQLCTLKTMELYAKIIGIRKLKSGKYIREENWTAPKEMVLYEAKKAMLEFIASRWHYSRDNEESEDCFRFLVSAFESASHHKEEKLLEEVMTVATPDYFPKSRLMRHHLLLSSLVPFRWGADHKARKIAKILANAWVNGGDFKERNKIFRSIHPIADLSTDLFSEERITAAFDFLGRTSAEIAQFHLALDELFASMKKRDVMQVPGNRQVSYHSTKWATVRIEVEINPGYYRSTRKEISEDGHKWFELARDYTIKWQEQHRQYKVDLELVAKMQHNETLIFERKQTIG